MTLTMRSIAKVHAYDVSILPINRVGLHGKPATLRVVAGDAGEAMIRARKVCECHVLDVCRVER